MAPLQYPAQNRALGFAIFRRSLGLSAGCDAGLYQRVLIDLAGADELENGGGNGPMLVGLSFSEAEFQASLAICLAHRLNGVGRKASRLDVIEGIRHGH